MLKYAALRERLWGHPTIDLVVPEAATDAQLARVHTPSYLAAALSGSLGPAAVRRMGFPWSPELVERSRRSVGGTVSAGRVALGDGWAVNLAGGTHHAYPTHGEGFCVFNDVAVAIRDLQNDGLLTRVAVIDLDVHQGNGTAAVFSGDPTVFTLSVHGASNYPFRKERSDLDIALDDGTHDGPFLDAVVSGVRVALASRPELVFYLAGVDPYQGDALGRLGVSAAGLAERDRQVYDLCERAGIPVATVMAGGYAPDVDIIADLHATTVREAARRWSLTRPAQLLDPWTSRP